MKTFVYALGMTFALNAKGFFYQGDFSTANDAGDGTVATINVLSSQTSSNVIELQATGSPDKKYVDMNVQEAVRIEAGSTTSSAV